MISPHERIIFPLDLPTFREAKRFITLLDGHVGLFKVGLELFVREGPAVLKTIAEYTRTKIFLDLKLHDIPETVSRALKAVDTHKARFITVHGDEGEKLLQRASASVSPGTGILAVTVLTSLSSEDLKVMGLRDELQNPSTLVMHRAEIAYRSGCAGVVCSGREVRAVKERFGRGFITVVPGIRPEWSRVAGDDQERITTPAEAVEQGADYIVIGRPIRDAADPVKAAEMVAKEIKKPGC